jgi:hypothetical protein
MKSIRFIQLQYSFDYQITIDSCPLIYTVKMDITDVDCGGIVLGCGTVFVNNAFSNNDGVNEEFFYRQYR